MDGAAVCGSSSAMAARPMFVANVSRRDWGAQWSDTASTVLNVLTPWWTSTTTGAATLESSRCMSLSFSVTCEIKRDSKKMDLLCSSDVTIYVG